MSKSELHDWECEIEELSGNNVDKMLEIAQDIYNTAFVRGKNHMTWEQQNWLKNKEKAEKELEDIKKGYSPEFPNASREAMGLPPIKKPQGTLLLAKSNDTMLDVARNVIKAVETTIEVPTGLRSLTVNREQETKDRIQELIGYLNNYVEWR